VNHNKASVAVLISGILAILGSAFAILGASVSLLGLYLTPRPEPRSAMPAYATAVAAVGMLIILGLAVFGIITGIGLIRLRNWARLSILIWSAITVFFGAAALAFLLAIPFPASPGGPLLNPSAVKVVVAIVYGVPVVISIWWLLLFNKKSTKEQFTAASSPGVEGTLPAPDCPLLVQVIAVFFLFSLLWVVCLPFMHIPIPIIFFGHRSSGTGGKALFGLTSMLLAVGAIGLLKLQKWSYPLVLGVQSFWLISAAVSTLSPTYTGIMQGLLSEMQPPTAAAIAFSVGQLRFMSFIGILFSLLILGILVFYRRRFMEAASARAVQPRS
jgi:hypothetical protein